MTPPRTVIEAVLRHVPVLEPGIAQQIAVDVIAAFFAGEVTGPWHLCGITVPGVIGEPMWWDVNIPGDTTATRYRFSTESEARRVAHALNWRET